MGPPPRREGPEAPERVALGRVRGAHGLRGELRVRCLGDAPDGLLAVPEVEIEAPQRGAEETAGAAHSDRYEVESARPGRPGEVLLALAGVGDREAARALRGGLVTADPEALPPLPEGEFYWYQLVGCRVEAEGGRAVGRVRELMETGAHDVLVVQGEDGRDRLVPTARALMKEVDLERRRIVVEDLPGLFEPAASGAQSAPRAASRRRAKSE